MARHLERKAAEQLAAHRVTTAHGWALAQNDRLDSLELQHGEGTK